MKNYVVIDFETTGLDFEHEQITEVALIKYDEDFNEIGSMNTIVRLYEGKTLSPYIKNLTGLTEEFLSHGMSEFEAFLGVNKFVDNDTIVVAHYAPFDLAFMAKFGVIPEKFICTKSLADQLEPTESSSLVNVCERLGIKLENAHRAFADVKATAEVLQYMLKQNIEFVENYLVIQEDRPLKFIPYNTKRVFSKDKFKEEK